MLPIIKKTFNSSLRGFTLIELLLVVAIISILISIGLASFTTAQKRSRNAQRKADLAKVAQALETFYGDFNQYPVSSTSPNGRIEINATTCTGIGTVLQFGAAPPASSLKCGTAPNDKNYLNQLPGNPAPGGQYYYRSCNPADPSGPKQVYELYAQLEGESNTMPKICAISTPAGYNYGISSR